jgi:hypothetical protein
LIFSHIRNQHQKLRRPIYLSNLLTNFFFRRKTAFCLNSFVDETLTVPRSEFFDEKKSSLKDSKDIWVDAVFDADSEYVKKSIDFYNSFQKYSVVFKRSSKKLIFRLFLRKNFAYENMLLGLDYQTLKTAGLYLVPIKSYSKNNHLPFILAPIIVYHLIYINKINYSIFIAWP